jgi:hypothetical protein
MGTPHPSKLPSVPSNASESKIWCTKLLFTIDNSLQQHLDLLKDMSIPLREVPLAFISETFVDLQKSVLRWSLNVSIPDSMLSLTVRNVLNVPI